MRPTPWMAVVGLGVACARAPAPAAVTAPTPHAAAPSRCAPRLIATGNVLAVGQDALLTFREGAQLGFAGVEDGEALVAPLAAPGWRAPIRGAARAQLATDVVLSTDTVALAGAWVELLGAVASGGGVRPGDRVLVEAHDERFTEVACADLARRALRVVPPAPVNPRRLSDEIVLIGADGSSVATLPAGSVVDVLQSTGSDARVRAVVDDLLLTGWVPCSVVPDVPCVEHYGRIGIGGGLICGGVIDRVAPDDCAGHAVLRARAPLWTSPPHLPDAHTLPALAGAVDVEIWWDDGDARLVELTAPAPGVESATVWVKAADLDRWTCR